MKCRHCGAQLSVTLIDLGTSPPSNAYLTEEQLHQPEKWYPLRVLVCTECWLVQTEDFVGADEMFSDEYAYFSSYSTSWVEHARRYVSRVIQRFSLTSAHCVVEIAANDGYLLQFIKGAGIPCYGIEPTHSTAEAAREKGIEIIETFFGAAKAKELKAQNRQADLVVANNVLAHVPDINDFVRGISILLKPEGVCTFEFPHIINLIEHNQFDTIYHEHFSYLSLTAVNKIFEANGLVIFDIEEVFTHGGSLRVFAKRIDSKGYNANVAVKNILKYEEGAGINKISYYTKLQRSSQEIKIDLLKFLIEAKQQGKKVAGYGAAAKGNTLLNFSGIRSDLIPYVVDKNPEKQHKFLPGSRIRIVDERVLIDQRPEYVLVFPWNLKQEIMSQLDYIGRWGGKLVTAIPSLEVLG